MRTSPATVGWTWLCAHTGRVTLWLHVICGHTLTCYRLRPAATSGQSTSARPCTAASRPTRADCRRRPRHAVCNAHLFDLEEIVELEKAPDGWATRMQWRLLEARDLADHW